MGKLNREPTKQERAKLTPIAEMIAVNGDCSEEIQDLIGDVTLLELPLLFALVADISRTKGL